MDQVREDCQPVIITRKRGQAFVLMTLEQYEALDETAYLLRNPANARRLRESISQLERGGGEAREPDLDA
jgi:antitoxin YefM